MHFPDKEQECVPEICCTAPDGSPVWISVVDGVAAYTDILGDVWGGDPDDLECSIEDGGTPPTATPEVGGASIVDNTNNTSTITSTDIAGVATTDTVINNLLACDGSDIDVGTDRFVTWEQLTAYNRGHHVAWVDSGDGCTPAPITDCPAGLTATTCNPKGDIWQWDGTAWECCSVQSSRRRYDVPLSDYSNGAYTVSVPHEDLNNFPTGGTITEIDHCIAHTVTNDDCVPWQISATAYANYQSANIAAGSYLWMETTTAAANTVQWFGNMVMGMDNNGFSGGDDVAFNAHNSVSMASKPTVIAPGASETFSRCSAVRIYNWAVASAGAQPFAGTSFNNFVMLIDIERVKP